jgi:hypothetical protein
METAFGVGLFLLGLGAGLALGRWLAGRGVAAMLRDLARRKAEIRIHVLPLLEQRASGSGVPPDRRAHDQDDPLIAAIELGRAIQEVDARRDLPYIDTLEISAEAVQSELRRR